MILFSSNSRASLVQRSATWVLIVSWFVPILLFGLWFCLSTVTDQYWIGTLLAFGPRWLVLLPVVALAIPALVWRRRAIVPLGLAAVVLIGPVMGFCVPWRQAFSKVQSPRSKVEGTGRQIRILTCNTLAGRAGAQLEWLIEREQPEIVALQEWPSEKPVAGVLGTAERGQGTGDRKQQPGAGNQEWYVARAGGIVVASRLPIVASEPLESLTRRDHVIGLRCELLTLDGPVQFFALHLLTPRNGLEAVLEKGLGGLEELNEVTAQRQLDGMAVEAWIEEYRGLRQIPRTEEPRTKDEMAVPMIVAGDFNLTPESMIYRRQFGYLQNAFSTAGWGYGGTKFTRIHSVRIDHVLADEQWQVVSCKVGPDVGSDHRPVVASLRRVGSE
jgi:endonuclease/exonuclease/phosphatase (EEP) superfamily protein YafD